MIWGLPGMEEAQRMSEDDGHIDIASSTWRVVKWARWEPNWASYGAIWTLGPKAKLKPT